MATFFALADTDGSGTLDRTELLAALEQRLGAPAPA